MDMFGPDPYYFCGPRELQNQFAGWEIIESRYDCFDAPGPTTLIARKTRSG